MTTQEYTHYTLEECREMLPRWRSVIETDAAALSRAIESGDGAEIHRCAVNVKWDATNLSRIGLDIARQERADG